MRRTRTGATDAVTWIVIGAVSVVAASIVGMIAGGAAILLIAIALSRTSMLGRRAWAIGGVLIGGGLTWVALGMRQLLQGSELTLPGAYVTFLAMGIAASAVGVVLLVRAARPHLR